MWPDYYLWPRYRQIFCNCPPWQQCHAFIVQKMQYFSRTNNSRLYSVFKTLPLWVSWSNFCALFHLVIPFFFCILFYLLLLFSPLFLFLSFFFPLYFQNTINTEQFSLSSVCLTFDLSLSHKFEISDSRWRFCTFAHTKMNKNLRAGNNNDRESNSIFV